MGPQRMFGMTPWVRRLLVANLLVYLLQRTLFVDPRFQAVFGFTPLLALARPWTFLTYMFLHAGLLHLAFNLLALFVFGPPVEERMGSRAFLGYYLLCGLGGAALSFALMLLRPVDHIVGASAGVYGVMLAFAWFWPNQPIYVFPFPRSEEHTSELQSRLHLVCRLLLEKKKYRSIGAECCSVDELQGQSCEVPSVRSIA